MKVNIPGGAMTQDTSKDMFSAHGLWQIEVIWKVSDRYKDRLGQIMKSSMLG